MKEDKEPKPRLPRKPKKKFIKNVGRSEYLYQLNLLSTPGIGHIFKPKFQA